MSRQFFCRAAGVLILIAAQQSFADTISCSLTELNVPNGTNGTLNIELNSFSFGASNPADVGGGGLSPGKVSLSDFTFTSELDSPGTIPLVQLAATGTVFGSVNCSFYGGPAVVGAAPSPYLTALLTNVVIRGFSIGDDGSGNGTQRAKFRLIYKGIQWNPGP